MKYTIREVKDEIRKGITAYLQKDENGEYCLHSVNRIPFYLEGKPGIGKTEIVRQVADELQIGFVSFSITHHTRNSLLGLPVISQLECGKYTEYTMSEIIASVMEKEEKGQKEGILLLDEFNCASETIMPTMLAFLQTRNIGKYRLPEGWSIVLCGNPSAYNKSARNFDAAILDRVRKLEVDDFIKDFLDYAKEKHFHEVILEYLKINRQNFYRCVSEKNEYELVTSRGWENLSHTLKMYEKLDQGIDEKLIFQYLKSVEIAHSFHDFYWMFKGMIGTKELKEIINNKNIEKYIEIANAEKFEFRWKLAEQLCNMLKSTIEETAAVSHALEDTGFQKEFSKKISHVLLFLGNLSDSATLTERFLREINENSKIVNILANVKNEEYLNLCMKAYGEIETIAEVHDIM